MDLNIAQLFIKFCVSHVAHCSLVDLTKPKGDELISVLEECLVMALFLDDTETIIYIYDALGDLYRRTHQPAEAIHSYTDMLALFSDTGNPVLEIAINQNLGNIYQSIGEYHKAIEYHQEKLSIAKEIGDRQVEGAAYGDLGVAYYSIGEYRKAIEYHEKRLDIAKEIGERQGEGAAYQNLGNAFYSLGQYHKAIKYHEKSLNIAKEIGDRQGEGDAYGNLGVVYVLLGAYHKSIECHKKILSIAKEIDDKQREGRTYGNLGAVYQSLGQYHKAIEYHQKCLIIAKAIDDKRGKGNTYGNLGIAYHSLGQYQKAIENNEKRLSIAKAIDDKQGEGDSYGNLGIAYYSLGEYQKAIEYQENKLSIAKEIGDIKGEGTTYGNLGIAYDSLGEYHKAIECHEKRLSIAKKIGDRQGEGNSYQTLGSCYQSLGEYRKAIEYHEKSLSISKEIGDRQGEGNAYGNLGIGYRTIGEDRKSIECLEKTLSIAEEIGDRRAEAVAYLNLGNSYRSVCEHHIALEYYEHSLRIAREIGDRKEEAILYNNIGVVYQEPSTEDLTKSKEYLQKSIKCFEKLFDDLKDKDQFKVSIVDTFIKTYKMLSQVCIKTGLAEEALMVCERGRARALRDLLFLKYKTSEKAESKDLELADVKRISSYRESCILFYNLHDNKVTYHCWLISSRSPSAFFYDEMDNREALATIVSSLSEDDKVNIKTEYFQYLVDNCVRQLRPRERTKLEDQSTNLIDHENGEPVAATKSSKLSETALTVFRKVDRWCASTDDEDNIEPLDVLYHRLLSPVINQLNNDEVVIIPDGPLFMVPFAALQDPETGKYLSETKRIRLAPSLTTLKIIQESSDEHHAKSGALIIGNPTGDLPGSEEEAIEIGGLLGVQPLIGKQATKEVILKKLKQGVSVIHFAAHGSDKHGQIFLAPSNPQTISCPEDGNNSILTMREAQECGICAQLVVLSCCHSGKGDIRSEGVVGIARAFLAAGARAVVATLRAIDDRATMLFMLRFYWHLKEGESASASLQQAMKEMREIERYKEPKYWAAFVLIGDDVTITV